MSYLNSFLCSPVQRRLLNTNKRPHLSSANLSSFHIPLIYSSFPYAAHRHTTSFHKACALVLGYCDLPLSHLPNNYSSLTFQFSCHFLRTLPPTLLFSLRIPSELQWIVVSIEIRLDNSFLPVLSSTPPHKASQKISRCFAFIFS